MLKNEAIELELVSADVMGLISSITSSGLAVYSVKYKDDLTAYLQVQKKHYNLIQNLAAKQGAKCRQVRHYGFDRQMRSLLKRPVVLLFLSVLMGMTFCLPNRILFIDVQGNQTIPDKLILETVNSCGVYFGARRNQVRSENVKNELIGKIPQLQWVGVNTKGCTAIIQVEERTEEIKQEINDHQSVSSIVAVCDGVISNMTVLQGSAVCDIGQAVKKDQILISGYTDCGIALRATQAKGEVYARTYHDLRVLVPPKTAVRGDKTQIYRKYGLKIGKKQINFYKDSGISDTGCVKMYEEKCINLPGGYALPVWLTCQSVVNYDSAPVLNAGGEDYDWVKSFCSTYLSSKMVAGEITKAEFAPMTNGDAFCLHAGYSCIEMIGKSKNEECIDYNGENS